MFAVYVYFYLYLYLLYTRKKKEKAKAILRVGGKKMKNNHRPTLVPSCDEKTITPNSPAMKA